MPTEKKEKIEIKRIVLSLKGKDIHLSVDEAKELKAKLGDLLEVKELWSPRWIPWYPYQVYTSEDKTGEIQYTTTYTYNGWELLGGATATEEE